MSLLQSQIDLYLTPEEAMEYQSLERQARECMKFYYLAQSGVAVHHGKLVSLGWSADLPADRVTEEMTDYLRKKRIQESWMKTEIKDAKQLETDMKDLIWNGIERFKNSEAGRNMEGGDREVGEDKDGEKGDGGDVDNKEMEDT